MVASVSRGRKGLFDTERGVEIFLYGMQAVQEAKGIQTRTKKSKIEAGNKGMPGRKKEGMKQVMDEANETGGSLSGGRDLPHIAVITVSHDGPDTYGALRTPV